MSRVWIVDDDRNLVKVLDALIREDGHESRTFPDAATLLAALADEMPDVIVTDLQMPRMDGLELLRILRERAINLPVIVLTAHGSVDRAVEAMKSGAYDFLTKPMESEKFLVSVRNACERGRLLGEVATLRERRREDLKALVVGESAAIRRVLDLAIKVAPSTATVLITGETGTGKEVVARAIHAASLLVAGPFVPVNCGAIPPDLVESELFGHVRGSFTGAIRDRKGRFREAHGGTLFLDEIGDLPMASQAKLLRVIESRTVMPVGGTSEVAANVRVVAATNHDLQSDVRNGRFREDLFFRLNVYPIILPPLRSRREDVPLLAAHFLALLSDNAPEIEPEALSRMQAHDWPGNVRELRNVLERALVLSADSTIRPEHLVGLSDPASVPRRDTMKLDIPEEGFDLDEVEQNLIRRALEKTGGNRSAAARLLGIRRNALLYRMEKFGIR